MPDDDDPIVRLHEDVLRVGVVAHPGQHDASPSKSGPGLPRAAMRARLDDERDQRDTEGDDQVSWARWQERSEGWMTRAAFLSQREEDVAPEDTRVTLLVPSD